MIGSLTSPSSLDRRVTIAGTARRLGIAVEPIRRGVKIVMTRGYTEYLAIVNFAG